MNQVIKRITIDVSNETSFEWLEAVQGDNVSRYVYISLSDHGVPYALDNIIPVIRGEKSDGTSVFNSCQLTENGEIIVELTSQMLSAAGKSVYEIALYGTDMEVLTSFPFYLSVHPANFCPEKMVSTDEYTMIAGIMKNVNHLYDAVAEATEQAGISAESAEASRAAEAAALAAEAAALAAQTEALTAQTAAADSADTAAARAAQAQDSAAAAKAAETAARAAEAAALSAQTAAKASETKAADSKTAASDSETKAKASEQNARKYLDDTAEIAKAQQIELNAYYQQSSGYTDQKIADLINGAPSTLDTLGEIAKAMTDNANVVAALDHSIGSKASEAEFDSHVKDKSAHVTAAERNSWNAPSSVFTQAAARANIASGEKLSVIFGKIMKWFADLKTVAFSGKYTDLTGTPASLKNPNPLTFTGGVTGSYDGSAAKSVAIPTSLPADGGTADSASYARYLGTLAANGSSHGTAFPCYCIHNRFGDNRFAFGVDGFEMRVDHATKSGYADSAGSAARAISADSVAYGNVTGRPTFSLSGTTLNISF